MAALKDFSLSLESEVANRRSLALKAMATHASVVKQAQGHHDEFYSVCALQCQLHVVSAASRMACQAQQTRCCTHTKAHKHSLREQHGLQHATQRDRNLTIFFSNH